jgi:hypothetical protein
LRLKVPQRNGGREADASASNFIRSIIASDVEAGRTRIVVTRFPPEPNGFLHLGHAKSIVLNYDLAKEFGGRCNLRLDDTNPAKERGEYIVATIHWVSAVDVLPAEFRLYGWLFSAPSPSPTDLAADLDPHSMHTLRGYLVERATASDLHGEALQFERQGYFSYDDDSLPERLVFNRTTSLRESPGKPQHSRSNSLLQPTPRRTV